jgi:hypothetical protein
VVTGAVIAAAHPPNGHNGLPLLNRPATRSNRIGGPTLYSSDSNYRSNDCNLLISASPER